MKLFGKLICTLGLLSAFAVGGAVQAKPFSEGLEYKILPRPIAVENAGKVEVIEFFGYFCPHCHEFEPELKAWVKKQGKDVVLRRVPVVFRQDMMPHAQIYYALEALGKLDTMHEKVFYAFHKEHKRLLDPNEIGDLMASNGMDKAKFLEMYKSMGVVAKARAAKILFDSHTAPGILDGVPTLVVQGKYVTSPSIASAGRARATEVLDYLVGEVRAKRK